MLRSKSITQYTNWPKYLMFSHAIRDILLINQVVLNSGFPLRDARKEILQALMVLK